jgi:hypothetical protein
MMHRRIVALVALGALLAPADWAAAQRGSGGGPRAFPHPFARAAFSFAGPPP